MHSKSTKTFKPNKKIAEGTSLYQLHKDAQATLGSGNLRLAVALPLGEDVNEWVAVNSELLHLGVSALWLALKLCRVCSLNLSPLHACVDPFLSLTHSFSFAGYASG